MYRVLPQIVALLLSVLPWAAVLGPSQAKPEATLSSPHQPQLVPDKAPPFTGNAPLGAAFVLGSSLASGRAPRTTRLLACSAPTRPDRRFLRFSRLQLDGG